MYFLGVSLGFQVIIERMLSPKHTARPSADKILKYSTVKEVEKRDKKQPRVDYAVSTVLKMVFFFFA